MLNILPCLDSPEMGAARHRELRMERAEAARLGRSAVAAIADGFYLSPDGQRVDWSAQVRAAIAAKVSIPPDMVLPEKKLPAHPVTALQVTNETTMGAGRRLVARGCRPLALNFAAGVNPGGGFLSGARAQEESLCRSSALYATLVGDPMYAHHALRPEPDSTDWAILSPDVPFFRTDAGEALEAAWEMSVLTCAAPYAKTCGVERSAALMEPRVRRVLEIAAAYGYSALILGAWGCGAFGNDARQIAAQFHRALTGPFAGAFAEIVFAISDWSEDRRFIGPFRDVFAAS